MVPVHQYAYILFKFAERLDCLFVLLCAIVMLIKMVVL